MKKIISSLSLFLLIELGVFAQDINKIEYFIDTDPGFGAGIDIPVITSMSVTANFNVPVTSVADGFHFLTVRAKDDNNHWGVPIIRPFYKETLTTPPNIVALEYFIDADPEFGAGTAVSFTTSNNITQAFTVPLPNTIVDGFHFLTVRAKDANNHWGVPIIRPFYKETLTTQSNIVAMEYFIDADPGFGAGTAVSFAAGTPITINFPVNLGILALGSHKILVRTKDANDKWSIVGIKDFTVSNTFALASYSTPQSWCRETAFNLPFTAVGAYSAGNVFTAQLSNATGSFASPTTIGTLTGSGLGTIVAILPTSVALGSGYQIRVISSLPAITDNPSVPITIVDICPPPCPTNLNLVSTADDYSSGILIKQANATNGIIIASNKITSTSQVTYQAKNIILNNGFKAENGTVFKAEIGGCSN